MRNTLILLKNRPNAAAEELIEKTAEIGQTWLCGVGFARFFNS